MKDEGNQLMRFVAGDIIKVYTLDDIQYIGKALQSRGFTGLAYFSVLLPTGKVQDFNLNYDEAEVIWSDPFSESKIALMMEK